MSHKKAVLTSLQNHLDLHVVTLAAHIGMANSPPSIGKLGAHQANVCHRCPYTPGTFHARPPGLALVMVAGLVAPSISSCASSTLLAVVIPGWCARLNAEAPALAG